MPSTRTIDTAAPLAPAEFFPEIKDHVETLWQYAALFVESVGGTATAYTGTVDPEPEALVPGVRVLFIPDQDCGITPTLNIGVGGAIAIKGREDESLFSGSLNAGTLYELVYDGAAFRLTSDHKLRNLYELISEGGTAYAYTASTVSDVTALVAGFGFWFEPDQDSGISPTLDINGIGAKDILDIAGELLPEGALRGGSRYLLSYDGAAFRLTYEVFSGTSAIIQLVSVGGSSTVYTATSGVPVAAYEEGQTYWFTPDETSGATPTLNVNGLGARAITSRANESLPAGALVAGTRYLIVVDSTTFRLASNWQPGGPIELTGVGGTSAAFTATSAQALGGYYTGVSFWFTPNADAAAAPTLNVSSLGAKAIRDPAGSALEANALLSGTRYLLVYDGTNLRLSYKEANEYPIQLFSVGGTSTAYTASTAGNYEGLLNGQSFWFIPDQNSGAAPTLNINSVGAVTIEDRDGNSLRAGALISGRKYLLNYDTTNGFRLTTNEFENPIYLQSVSGTAAYTATAPWLPALEAGQLFIFVPGSTNTGGSSLNINSLGAKTIRTRSGAAVGAGQLIASVPYILYYDGTSMLLTSGNEDTPGINDLTDEAGGPQSYTANASVAFSAYAAGQVFNFTPNVDNDDTDTVSINISSKGVRGIKDRAGGNLPAGALVAGSSYLIVYDGSVFRLAGEYRYNLGPWQLFNVSGSAYAYVAETTDPIGLTLRNGMSFWFIPDESSIEAPTLQINSLPSAEIRDISGGVLPAGALRADYKYLISYDATNGFRVASSLTDMPIQLFSVGGTSSAFTADTGSVPYYFLRDGSSFWFIPNTDSAATPTLNINGLGAVEIEDISGDDLPASALLSGYKYLISYDVANGFRLAVSWRTDHGSMVLESVTGTGTYTATTSVPLTAYEHGQQFLLQVPDTNTSSVTLDINGIGAKAVRDRNEDALLASSLKVDVPYEIFYDGTANGGLGLFKLLSDFRDNDGPRNLTNVSGSSYAYSADSDVPLVPDGDHNDGTIYVFIPHVTSTDAPTLSINSRVARNIVGRSGAVLGSGALIANTMYLLAYDRPNLQFRVLNHDDSGQFPAELTIGGGPVTWTATTSFTLTALATGQSFWFTPDQNSGASPTLNINSIGAASLRDRDDVLLTANALISGRRYLIVYDGNTFRIASAFEESVGPYLLTSVAGTSPNYTATALGVGAYETGQTFLFTPHADTTGAPTINVNSQTAKAIRDHTGTALTSGALKSGHQYLIVYDGTLFRVVSTGIFSAFRWLTVAGTAASYTATSDFVSLTAGQGAWFTPHVNNSANPTLNINGGGAKALRDMRATALVADQLIADTTYAIVYDGTLWRLLDNDVVGPLNMNWGVEFATGGMFAGWDEAEQRFYCPPIDLKLADAENRAYGAFVRSVGVMNDVAWIRKGWVNIIVGIGQSKMRGAQGGPSIDRIPIPYHYMVGDQERSQSAELPDYIASGGSRFVPARATTLDTSGNPMSESEEAGLTYGQDVSGQTSIMTMSRNLIIMEHQNQGYEDPDTWFVTINLGIGGKSADELRKNHTQGATEFYAQYPSALGQISALSSYAGKSCQVIIIARSQGESDELGVGLSDNGNELYSVIDIDYTDRWEDAVTYTNQPLIRPDATDILENRVRPAYFYTVPGEGYARDQNPSGEDDSMIANTTMRLMLNNRGRRWITGPDYPYSNITSQHHDANGYRHRGCKWAQVAWQVMRRRENWEPARIRKLELRGDVALAYCHVPVGRLQIAAPYENAGVATNGLQAGGVNVLGFRCHSLGLQIGLTATIVSETCIAIDLTSVPEVPQGIWYAPQAYTGNGYICDEDQFDPGCDWEELAGVFNLPAGVVNTRYDMRNFLCPGYFRFDYVED